MIKILRLAIDCTESL